MRINTLGKFGTMADFRRVFVDTAPIIYFLEKKQPLFIENIKSTDFFEEAAFSKIQLVTSAVTIEEYLVYPYKRNRSDLILNFEEFILEMKFEIIDINRETAKKAADIRGKYAAFKALDSFQLSAAMISSCDLFLTNDMQLKQFDKISVRLLEEV